MKSIPINMGAGVRFRAAGILCKAEPHGDDMMCTRCKFLWAIGDPKPPRCLTGAEIRNDPVKPLIEKLATISHALRK